MLILKQLDTHAGSAVLGSRAIRQLGWALPQAQPSGLASGLPETDVFLLPDSLIDPATIQAYRETHYCVHADTPVTLHVGVASAALAALYKARRAQSCAFITACNPFGQVLDASANAERQQALERELRQRSLKFTEGIGQHPSGNWPGEPSFLVWDMSLEASKALGKRHEQNAILWCASDTVPQLVLLR